MFLVGDIFLIEVINIDFLLAMGCSEELQKVPLELVAVVGDVFPGVFADEEHLTHVGF